MHQNLKIATHKKITVAKGDGIGPEIMEPLNILKASRATKLENNGKINTSEVKLEIITNRGITICPDGYKVAEGNVMTTNQIIDLMSSPLANKIDVIKTQYAYAFEGKRTYSLGQGQ